MSAPHALLLIALGLVLGSFATAMAYRLPRGMPVAMDRSRCPACLHPLSSRDLVPVLSWLLARGRCRYCAAKVSVRYPLTELALALAFLPIGLAAEPPATEAALLASVTGLAVILLADLERRIIPNKALIALLLPAFYIGAVQSGGLLSPLLGAALGLGLGALLRLGARLIAGRSGLGLGDVKFLGLAGLFLGPASFAPFLLIAGIGGVLFGLVWRAQGKGREFPFGPALAAALYLCLAFPALGGLFAHV